MGFVGQFLEEVALQGVNSLESTLRGKPTLYKHWAFFYHCVVRAQMFSYLYLFISAVSAGGRSGSDDRWFSREFHQECQRMARSQKVRHINVNYQFTI